MRYFFETYGCQMNKAESAALELVLKERGWTADPDGEGADLVLLNTCSVRATAETRVLSRISHYNARKRQRPFRLVVAGCMAERLAGPLKGKAKGVDHLMGTASRSLFPLILDSLESGAPLVLTDEKPAFSFSSSHLEEGEFRAFVPIMHGCDNFCSYCIVPYVRGREISRDPASVLAEIALLEEKGVREITLLGQNVNSYRWEKDGRTVDFPALLRLAAEAVKGIRWVRFLSSHPKDFDPATIQVMKDHPVLCRHIHLCAQHGSDRILTAMNRRHSAARYLEIASQLRAELPDLSLSSDILIGFPGETEDDLEATLDLMRKARFAYAYMYHYNPREGTAAYTMEGRIPEEVKKARLAKVIALQQEITKELMRGRLGTTQTVIVDGFAKRAEGELLARTVRDEMVAFPGPASLIGSFAEITVSSLRGTTFRAKEARPCSPA